MSDREEQTKKKEIDHRYTAEIVCPHCGYEFRDSFEFDDDGITECYECEESFSFERQVDITYSTNKIDER